MCNHLRGGLLRINNLKHKQSALKLKKDITNRTMTSVTTLYSGSEIRSKDPNKLFDEWFKEASENKRIKHPGVFCLATSSRDGFPTARFVVMTKYDKEGFIFFTDYCSNKAIEIAENPNVAGSFYWEALGKSIKFQGCAEKISEDESKIFFKTRPLASQIAVWGSQQSTPIKNKNIMREKMEKIEEEYVKQCKEIPKPPYWGGYKIRPYSIEFWQNSKTGLADCIRFRRSEFGDNPDGKALRQGEDGWIYEILSP